MRSIRTNNRRPALVILVSALALGGCFANPSASIDKVSRVAVSGTVTLNGTPLPAGAIQLAPTQGTEGPAASGEISEGKFSIDKPQGPVPGKYKVRISGRPPAKIEPGEAPGGTPKLTPEPVPARYNTESTLETEVPVGGSSALEFPLKKS